VDALHENKESNGEQDRGLCGCRENLRSPVTPGAAGVGRSPSKTRGGEGNGKPTRIRGEMTGIDHEGETAGQDRAEDLGQQDADADAERGGETAPSGPALAVIVCHEIRLLVRLRGDWDAPNSGRSRLQSVVANILGRSVDR
jgi:hypothetical protein